MLTEFFRRCGFTRDMALWLWLKILGGATLVLTGVIDPHYWLAYLGLPASDVTVHRIMVGCGVILYLGGQFSAANLPSKAEVNSVTPPKGAA